MLYCGKYEWQDGCLYHYQTAFLKYLIVDGQVGHAMHQLAMVNYNVMAYYKNKTHIVPDRYSICGTTWMKKDIN